MKDNNVKGPLPTRKAIGKVSDRSQDFSGQDGYEESQTEGVADAPELDWNRGDWGLTPSFTPTIDDPSVQKAELTVFASDDPRLHLSRMSSQEPENPVHYRGPDKRHI